jgi:resuscitation-promoting factor RpfB
MAGSGIPGLPVALVAGGGVLVFSGVENTPVAAVVRSLSQGKAPAPGPGATTTTESGTAGTAAAGDTSAHNAGAAANQAIAKVMAAPRGWATGQEWADLVSLWNQESEWSNVAQNPGSGAYGIAQFLDSTWAAYGPKTSNPALQIRYGLEYIAQRYGSPSAAWAHEQADNWY